MLTLKPNSILLICQILQFLVIALKKEGYVEYMSKTILLLQPLPPPPPDIATPTVYVLKSSTTSH
jgi:hypothetical protein